MSTPQLNRDEQARVDYVTELEEHRRNGTKYVNDHQLAEVKKVADLARLNAELRAQRLAGLEQARQARAAAAAAAQQARVEAEIDVFKQQARRAFPGTVAEFEAQWPEILKQWQQQQTLAALNAAPISRERWL
jgi:phage protein D